MSRIAGVRWRLVVWVTAVLVVSAAVIFVVVYEQTGSQLRAQIDRDVKGDLSQLAQTVHTLPASTPSAVARGVRHYLGAQSFTATSALLFAVIPGHGTVSNHPEVFGDAHPDDGETPAEQRRENALGQALLAGAPGLATRDVADVGEVRVRQRVLTVGGLRVRVGAGEPLAIVTRAQHSLARSFILAGALALALALIASYLAGASVSLPLRRMARIASRVDDGELHPRMNPPASAGREVRVLADSFNHMLDRLATAFSAQRDFIADASHELRTPLTVIGGQLEVLAGQEHPSAEEVQRVQRTVSGEIARTARLVDDMLLLVGAEHRDFLVLEEFELRPFTEDLWASMSATEARRFELGTVPDVVLNADPDRLTQALRNLIRNAIQHTDEPDGIVALEVAVLPSRRVRFTVSDDGPGIPEDQRERIFERFHRTDAARSRANGGAGLGLAIVRAIALAHGGDVRASGRAGDRAAGRAGGAQFQLDVLGLVLDRARAADESPPHGSVPRPAGQRGTAAGSV